MTSAEFRQYLEEMVGCITFDYNGYACGVDPLAYNDFDVWYGNDMYKARSVDEVMNTEFFNGNALKDIMDDITNLDY